MNRRHHILYICVVGAVFALVAAVLVFFPRPRYSALERRDLAVFPDFDAGRLASGDFTADVSRWFSDSEPFRDRLMALSNTVREAQGLRRRADDVVFVAAEPVKEKKKEKSAAVVEDNNRDIADYQADNTDANAKIAHAGIVITGEPGHVRALMAFGGTPKAVAPYAAMVNDYRKALGINVYCMTIPTAIEYYCPEKARAHTQPQAPVIRALYAALDTAVRAVDVYTALGRHASEDIFLRTDHHWSALGAFYAAQQLARVARVPFRPLSAYERRVVPGFVGTMYAYSRDASVKESPEDFVWYCPRDTGYRAVFTHFALDKDFKITSEGRPTPGTFFKNLRGGAAYSTFMGGDAMIVRVATGVRNGRRLAIVKDSYGNAVPGYLFGSFEEVHVIDHRYFPRSMPCYVADNGITDLVFAHNIFSACAPAVTRACHSFLNPQN